MYFHYFIIISPTKMVGPFIWRNLNPLHPRMLCAKIGWNWLSASGEFFFNFINAFSLFRNYLPLERDGVLHLNKLESPSPKDALCQVWLKLAQCFRRRWTCDRQTDDGRQVIRKAHLNFQLRWTKYELRYYPDSPKVLKNGLSGINKIYSLYQIDSYSLKSMYISFKLQLLCVY